MKKIRIPAAAVAFSGVVLALAGCSAAAATPVQSPGAGAASASASAGASSPAPAATAAHAGSFKDGTYSATGDYTSPGGPSGVAVTVTLKNDTVAAVKVVPQEQNPTGRAYEAAFASGVGSKVIGKKITDLHVGAVSGSSLTVQGFDKAIAAIQAKARA